MSSQAHVSDTKILIFLKFPNRGDVKTRLFASLKNRKNRHPETLIGDNPSSIKQIQETDVLKLYSAFVHDVIATVQKTHQSVVLYCQDNASKHHYLNWLSSLDPSFSNIPIRWQSGNHLGEKLTHACDETIQSSANPIKNIIVIGTDCPQMSPSYLTEAIHELTTSPMVIGPSTDGGYTLIGSQIQAYHPHIFESINWSSEQVCSQTIKNMKNIGISPKILPTLTDIDTAEDLFEVTRIFNSNPQVNEPQISSCLTKPIHTCLALESMQER